MTHRLVTFLGTGEYHPTIYELGEQRCSPSPWIALALNRLLEAPVSETVVLATDKAWERNGEALVEAFREAGRAEPKRVAIPEGRDEGELWDQFQCLKELLRVGPDAAVTIDITHALRHQPFFAAAVIGFVRSIDETPAPMRVVYGAFELGTEDEKTGIRRAPILDLTPFVELVDWTRSLTMFLLTGRVSDLGTVIHREKQEIGKRTGQSKNLDGLNKAIQAFARDVQTIRTGALILGTDEKGKRKPSSAKRLLDAVEVARDDVQRHMPPLADVLDRIAEMAKSLVFDGDALVGAKAKRVLANLADLYLDMGRYVEAITLLREARITAYCPPAAACPGLPEFDDGERKLVDERLWYREEPARVGAIAEIRNDIDHAGFRRRPQKGFDLIKNIESQRHDFCDLAFDLKRHEARVLANISNHLWHDWPEEQKSVALRLVGRVEDLPFPQVDPDWELNRIEREAEKLLKKIPPETTHALVQGEFTLTMALVKKLQAKGIRCLAATTERRVETTADGREVREFRFVRFREYPKLA